VKEHHILFSHMFFTTDFFLYSFSILLFLSFFP
jgi:hypothetical protein